MHFFLEIPETSCSFCASDESSSLGTYLGRADRIAVLELDAMESMLNPEGFRFVVVA
jgi:hypothetical protein